MTDLPSRALLSLAEIAWHAGEIILAHYAVGVDARQKEDKSPVTAADEDAELFRALGLPLPIAGDA